MKKGVAVLIGMMIVLLAEAQVTLRTIVTPGPVVAGESFQVQYVFQDKEGRNADFFQPDFKPFKFISGPNVYEGVTYDGDALIKLKNITFTLVAPKEGHYMVPGASVKSQGQLIRSEPSPIEVISRATAMKKGMFMERSALAEGSFLLPGEDPVEKMKKNIFIKVLVDKKTCYVGQPVTATFKLYSRLNSKSDIIKNPGFYGFAMQDMAGLADDIAGEEVVNGKKFQVHTIRKVQLYPLQAGTLTIDPMEVQNKVEFSTSVVSNKTEQEIIEGVLPSEDELFSTARFKYCENSMHTEPVAVKVNALPENNKPDTFDGATGKFRITAVLEKPELGINEEGDLLVSITGKGNFIQLTPPVISWPANIEGFTPQVKDSLNKHLAPLEGSRAFRFRFVSTKKGEYTIPAITISFFDPDSNRYKTISTQPLIVKVTDAAVKTALFTKDEESKVTRRPLMIWAGLGLAVVVITGLWFFRKKRRSVKEEKDMAILQATPQKPEMPGISQLLQPAVILLQADDHSFYGALRKAIWDFSSGRFGLSGSNMNKRSLQNALETEGADPADQQALIRILDTCETGLFTGASSSTDKQQLLDESRAVMLRIDAKK